MISPFQQFLELPFLAIALALCGMGIAGIQRKHTTMIMVFIVYLVRSPYHNKIE